MQNKLFQKIINKFGFKVIEKKNPNKKGNNDEQRLR